MRESPVRRSICSGRYRPFYKLTHQEFAMPLYMDVHHKVDGLTAEAVAGAPARDLEVQDAHCVNYLQYWFDEGSGKVFCLVDAPNAEAAHACHREAHGLVA